MRGETAGAAAEAAAPGTVDDVSRPETPGTAGTPGAPGGAGAQGTGGAAIRRGGMSRTTARTIEWSIIALCLASLVFVFQPVSPALHAAGMVLVVVGGLAFNLVPLCRPGRPAMGLVRITAVIALILAVAIGIAMGTASLYGDYVRATACPNERPGSRNWERKLKCEQSRWLICEQIGPDTKPAVVEWCATGE